MTFFSTPILTGSWWCIRAQSYFSPDTTFSPRTKVRGKYEHLQTFVRRTFAWKTSPSCSLLHVLKKELTTQKWLSFFPHFCLRWKSRVRTEVWMCPNTNSNLNWLWITQTANYPNTVIWSEACVKTKQNKTCTLLNSQVFKLRLNHWVTVTEWMRPTVQDLKSWSALPSTLTSPKKNSMSIRLLGRNKINGRLSIHISLFQ